MAFPATGVFFSIDLVFCVETMQKMNFYYIPAATSKVRQASCGRPRLRNACLGEGFQNRFFGGIHYIVKK